MESVEQNTVSIVLVTFLNLRIQFILVFKQFLSRIISVIRLGNHKHDLCSTSYDLFSSTTYSFSQIKPDLDGHHVLSLPLCFDIIMNRVYLEPSKCFVQALLSLLQLRREFCFHVQVVPTSVTFEGVLSLK